MNRYFLRSTRYFLKLVAIVAVVLAILFFSDTLNVPEGDTHALLKRGGVLLLFMVALAAAYPKLSFDTIVLRGEGEVIREAVRNGLATLNYEPVSTEGNTEVYRARSASKRLTMAFDDAVTVYYGELRTEVEGPKKVVLRADTRIKHFMIR